MADAAQRLQRLEDIEAIRNIIALYGILADAGEAQAAAALWASDGEYDVGGFHVARGRDAIAALLTSDMHQQLMSEGCAHILSPHHIVINGDHATATGYSRVYRKTEEGYAIWRVSTNHWEFARQSVDQWRATKRINRPVGPHPQ